MTRLLYNQQKRTETYNLHMKTNKLQPEKKKSSHRLKRTSQLTRTYLSVFSAPKMVRIVLTIWIPVAKTCKFFYKSRIR